MDVWLPCILSISKISFVFFSLINFNLVFFSFFLLCLFFFFFFFWFSDSQTEVCTEPTGVFLKMQTAVSHPQGFWLRWSEMGPENFILFAYQGHTCSIWRFPDQGSNWSCRCWPPPQPQQCQIRAANANYTTAHSNARSLTHWERGQGLNPHPHKF